MKNNWMRKGFAAAIILLFVGTFAIPSLAQESKKPSLSISRGNWLYVGGSGLGNYSRIQDAIDNASDGDTVFVYDDSSPYYENIVVERSIRLLGENKTTTIIDGPLGGDVVSIRTDGVTFSEFSIQYHCSYPSSDISLHANHSCISHTIMSSSNWFGISLLSSCDTKIVGNTISNKYAGISLNDSSNNNTITENDITHNNYGVEIASSSFNLLYYNTFMNNTVNAYDDGSNTWNSTYPSAGNYWDDYTGVDACWGRNQEMNGSDGVGDTPMSLPGGENQDRYPLMEPYAMTRLAFSSSSGGFGVAGTIKNVGNATAFRVCWRLTLTGCFILLGRETLREIPKPLLPGEEASVKSNMILGLGRATLTMMFWADNAPLISGNWSATVLLFFIIGIKPTNLYGPGSN
jgi:parallel beta-helix repeat protein